MNLAPAKDLLNRHKDKATASGGIVLAISMVLTWVDARDARHEATQAAHESAVANLSIHDRLSRIEGALTYRAGTNWVVSAESPTVEAANRSANITPPREIYQQRSFKK